MGDDEEWLERVWEYREEVLYPRLMGMPEGQSGIYLLTFERFRDRFDQDSIDPRWLHHGVLVYRSPSSTVRYVTSGMSNAWEDDEPNPALESGLGVELVLEVSEPSEWALNVSLNILAVQLLLAVGRLGTSRLLEIGDRIPLRGPIDGGGSQLSSLLVAECPAAPGEQQLESGTFRFLTLVGISEAEAQFARDHDSQQLLAILAENDAFPVTRPERNSLVPGV
jgi:hypothetical protein